MHVMRIYLLALALVQFSCRQTDEISSLSAVFDGESMRSIQEVYEYLSPQLRDSLEAIGHMNGQCTAFHLGGGIVASAAHCFAKKLEPSDPCISTRIEWPSGAESQCIQIIEYDLSEGRDMAYFQVDPVPNGSLSLDSQASERLDLLVIGYPHERGFSLSQNCDLEALDEKNPQFFHNCDTLPGNSGSPVLSAQDFRVIGIHNGHNQINNYATFLQSMNDLQVALDLLNRNLDESSTKLNYGPFADSKRELLFYFPSHLSEKIKLDLDYDIEDGYDFLEIRDATGISYRLTGKAQKNFEFYSPVVFSFESDYAGQSKHVRLKLLEAS